ncbi:cannabinoid receptor 1-like [Ostrea edulis]|uniref:cannabinoid receptor 1-like n=1 Tax=Ostrea edulis TaxID=37623 RepID=UPI002094E4FF|nr:cannabinoid receptor 1-like [Ostrea edulis]XP_048740101.1 cannabinoid receptor 1-like [Ostrea edulis]
MANVNGMTSRDCRPNISLNCSPHVEQDHYSIPINAFFLFVGILTLVFNSGILVLIVKEKKIRLNLYHFLVLILCVSDVLVGLGFIFGILRTVHPAFQTSKAFAVLNVLLTTTGLYISLYHTFLISLQRFLVICKEKWNTLIFQQNRRYFVCVSGWIAILISNCIFISPHPASPGSDIISYVYNGHYQAYTIYIRFLTTSLLFSTVILYLVTIVYMLKTYRKISPTGDSNALQVIETINIHTIEPHPSQKACVFSCLPHQVRVRPIRSRGEASNQIGTLTRKKVMSTLYLVGLLITVLLIFTGPLVVTLSWRDTFPTRLRGILFGLCCINSTLNPIIYVWKLVDIRGIVKSALFCLNR